MIKRLLSSLTHWPQRNFLAVNWHCNTTTDKQWKPASRHPPGSSRGQWLIVPDGATTAATSTDTENGCNSPVPECLVPKWSPNTSTTYSVILLEANEGDSSLSFSFWLFIRLSLLITVSLNCSLLKLWQDVAVGLWDWSLFEHTASVFQPAAHKEPWLRLVHRTAAGPRHRSVLLICCSF